MPSTDITKCVNGTVTFCFEGTEDEVQEAIEHIQNTIENAPP